MEHIGKAGALLKAHWDEVAKNKHLMVLAPDTARYAELEKAGLLLAIGAFTEADEMVGYSVSFIGTNLHYSGLSYAHNDVVYLAKEHRGGRVGLQLLRETERLAKDRGAQLMLWHAKEQTTMANLLPRLGYGVQDIIFSKEL